MLRLVLGLLFSGSPAETDAAPVRVRWQAPAGCPDEAEVQAQVASMLRASTTAPRPVDADAVVEAREDGFALRLRMDGGDAREFEDPSCAVLAEATAVAVALAADPSASPIEPSPVEPTPVEPNPVEPDPVEPVPPPKPVPPEEPEPTPPPQQPVVDGPSRVEPPAAEPRVRRFELAAMVGGSFGVLPGPGVEAGGAFAWLRPRWALSVHGAHTFERSTGAGEPGVAVRLSRGGIEAGPRFVFVRGLDLRAVAGIELGVARGRGFRVASPATDRVFWRAFTAGATFARTWPVGVFVAADARLRASLGTVRFVVAGGDVLHTLGPIGGSVRLSTGMRF